MLDLEALPGLTRTERVQVVDTWLGGLLADAVGGTPPPRQRRGGTPPLTGTDGVALVAVGSLGRRELPPHGDLDLVLVHDGRPEIAAIADALWYPVWDTGLRLDHSVRSVPEAVTVASTDVKAGLGLLDARLVAGDAELAASAAHRHPRQLAPGGVQAAAPAPRPPPGPRPPARRARLPPRARPQGGLRRAAGGAGPACRGRRPAG